MIFLSTPISISNPTPNFYPIKPPLTITMAPTLLVRILNRTIKTIKPNTTITTRTYSVETGPAKELYSRMLPLSDKNARLTPLLDQWLREGGNVKQLVLPKFVKYFRSRERYGQALEFSEWISNNRPGRLSQSEHAMQLELIGKVRGLESAECYFQSLDSEDKGDKTYGALLYCYVMAGEVEKSRSLMQKMKELGFALSSLGYNGILQLYRNSGQSEKVGDVLSEMKENGVMPDIVTYRICMSLCGERGDLDSVDKILKELQSQQHITMDWHTYAVLSNIFIKAGQKHKALFYLRQCEAKDRKRRCYSKLISLYASLGNKDEVMRLWGLIKSKLKNSPNKNAEYRNMLSSLIKLGEFERSEKLLQEWEASCAFCDFRVPNCLLIGYSQKGLVEKAEAILWGIIERWKTVVPTSWAIVAAGYENKQNMEKALECIRSALALQAENKWWRPEPSLFSGVLSWLGDNGNIEVTEEFVRLLEGVVPKNRHMYHALIKAYIRGGKSVNELVDRMKDDKIDGDEETERILSTIR